MLDKILNGVDRALAYKLMLAHIIIIAISNYLVQFKFEVSVNTTTNGNVNAATAKGLPNTSNLNCTR